MTTILQLNLPLSSSSTSSSNFFPIPFRSSNVQFPAFPHFSVSNHSNLRPTNSPVLRIPASKFDKSKITCAAKVGELQVRHIYLYAAMCIYYFLLPITGPHNENLKITHFYRSGIYGYLFTAIFTKYQRVF